MQLNYDQLKQVFEAKGYSFFNTDSYNVNVFGIRANAQLADEFNDRIGIAFKDDFGTKHLVSYKATTDPGYFWLKNQLGNINGTAILRPGQYRKSWQLGTHRGYEALQQSSYAKFKVWRDNNANGILDESGRVYEDVKGLNCHTTSFIRDIDRVGKYSAGCQVIQDDLDFMIFLSIIKKSANIYGNYFTYTLLRENDI